MKEFKILNGYVIFEKNDNINDLIHFINNNDNVTGLSLQDFNSDHNLIFPFIRKIEKLLVHRSIRCNTDELICLDNLNKLLLKNDNKSNLQIKYFKKLEELELIDNKSIDYIDLLSNLKNLTINNYKSSDLSERFSNNKIETLQITSTNLKSLRGLYHFKSLKNIILAYTPKLTDISDLIEVKDTIETIEFENCKNVNIDDVFLQLNKLKIIKAYNVNSLTSTNILKQLTNLNEFYLLGNSRIINFDLTELRSIPYVNTVSPNYFHDKR